MAEMHRTCPQCQHDNRDVAKFCAACGTEFIATQEVVTADSVDDSSRSLSEQQHAYIGAPRKPWRRVMSVVLILTAGLGVGVGMVWLMKSSHCGSSPELGNQHRQIAVDHHHSNGLDPNSLNDNRSPTDIWLQRLRRGAKDPHTVQSAVRSLMQTVRSHVNDEKLATSFEVRYEVPESSVYAFQMALKSVDGDLKFYYRDNQFSITARADVHHVLRQIVDSLDSLKGMRQQDDRH